MLLEILIGAGFVALLFFLLKIVPNTKVKKINDDVAQKEKELLEKITKLNDERDLIQFTIENEQKIKDNISSSITELTNQMNGLKDSYDIQVNQQKRQLEEYYNSNKELVEEKLKQHLKEFKDGIDEDKEQYQLDYFKMIKEYTKAFKEDSTELQNKRIESINALNNEYAQVEDDLSKLKATRTAAIEAACREQEIKEQQSFYCITLNDVDKHDIAVLNSIKCQLDKPRILSMLIWQTYFRTPMNTLCNNVVGTATKTGIYKITNQLNGMCYIGQARDIASRWKQHAKACLEIDTPAGNKLYKAAIQDGLTNFTFEILEECSPEELDEKEKFYINLYDSYNFGYNSNIGITKVKK